VTTLTTIALLMPLAGAFAGVVGWATTKAAKAEHALEIARRLELAVERLEIAVAKLEAK
jgi:hypothetical protein